MPDIKLGKLEKDGVEVYAYLGLVHCSICHPKDMPIEKVLTIVNRLNPTGLDHDWVLSDEPQFRTGETNPCVCENNPDKLHRLLVC